MLTVLNDQETGVGLYIVRKIIFGVAWHRYLLDLLAGQGEGTTFRVTWPERQIRNLIRYLRFKHRGDLISRLAKPSCAPCVIDLLTLIRQNLRTESSERRR
jgi:hypothetical protein